MISFGPQITGQGLFSQAGIVRRYALAALLIWLFFTIYLLRLDSVFGMIVDDAWYVLLGKAIAEGQGLTLINSPTPGIRPFIPPGFPALLSLVFLINPEFPENLWMLKSISILSMLGAGIVSFVYFHRLRGQTFSVSLGIASALALYPALVFSATATVMSECVFTLLQLVSIALVERGLQREPSPGFIVSASAAAALAFLVRPAGAGLVAGLLLCLIVQKRRRPALLAGITLLALIGPWMIDSRLNAATPGQRLEVGANIVRPYAEQFFHRTAGVPSSGSVAMRDLPVRVIDNLSEIASLDMGAIAFYFAYRGLEPGEEVRLGGLGIAVSLLISVLVLIGYLSVIRRQATMAEYVVPLSLGASLIWGWEQFRFLLPLVPFLTWYLYSGVESLAGLVFKQGRETMALTGKLLPAVIIWVVVACHIYSNYIYIDRQYAPDRRMEWHGAFRENVAMMDYVKERIPADAVLTAQNPALVHLLTGRRTVGSEDPAGRWETWNRLGIRYLVLTSLYPLPPPSAAEREYRIIYRQSGRLGLRVIDLGPPSSRPGWGW